MAEKRGMTRNEFISNPAKFRFCLDPLDVNLAKIAFNLLKRMNTEGPREDKPFAPLIERYVSVNWERLYGAITVEIVKDALSLTGLSYIVWVTVESKDGSCSSTTGLCRNEWEEVRCFMDGKGKKWDFFSLCKANVLWFDYQMRNRHVLSRYVSPQQAWEFLMSRKSRTYTGLDIDVSSRALFRSGEGKRVLMMTVSSCEGLPFADLIADGVAVLVNGCLGAEGVFLQIYNRSDFKLAMDDMESLHYFVEALGNGSVRWSIDELEDSDFALQLCLFAIGV